MKLKIMIFILAVFPLIFTINSCIIFYPSERHHAEESNSDKISEVTDVVEDITGEYPENNKEKENTDIETYSDQIKVFAPVQDQLIDSPLVILGEARGTWFFEATFPLRLMDSNGNELAVHYAQAEGEWMTEDFVPFTAQIEFDKPDTSEGVLILEKNNPSDLREHDAQIKTSVRFK